VDAGIAIAGATAIVALLFAVTAVGVGAAVPADGGTPLAEAGLDQRVGHGETVRLDATGSYDPDGGVVAYEWRLRTPTGRTVSPLEPHAARTSFTATTVGRYEVTLTVTDDDGKTGTDTMYVLVEGAGSGAEGGPGPSAVDGPGRGDRTVAGSADTRGEHTDGDGVSPVQSCPGGDCPTAGPPTGTDPWVRIEGPRVVRAEQSYSYTAEAGGLADDRRYEWDGGDTGRRHTLRFRSRGEYTTRVGVSDGTGRVATDRLEVFVSPADNERPEVEIANPGRISAGQRLTLSADASDPDGRIRTTEWAPSRRVRVPDDGSSRTVRVTVTDDDGASATDSITLSGRAWNRTDVETGPADVVCYYTDERQRDGPNPYSDRCAFEGGNTVSLSSGPATFERIERNPNVDIEWRRTTQERLAELEANDTSRDHGTATVSSYGRADLFGYSEGLLSTGIVGQRARVQDVASFTLKGRTVEDDLNGDGEVNAADWDREFRTTGDLADVDPHGDTAATFKRSIRDDHGADGRDDGGVLGTGREAEARTIDGRFDGTSIDAENRRDRIAGLSHRSSIGGRSDRGSDGTTNAEREDRPDEGDDTDPTEGTDQTEDTDHTDDMNDTDDSDETDETHSTGGQSTDSGTEGSSRHTPHGGRIVTHP
jgi:hypothetical protein